MNKYATSMVGPDPSSQVTNGWCESGCWEVPPILTTTTALANQFKSINTTRPTTATVDKKVQKLYHHNYHTNFH